STPTPQTLRKEGAPPPASPPPSQGPSVLPPTGGTWPTRPAVEKRDTFSDPKRRNEMPANELHETAKALVAEGKGILAADESDSTIKKRFDSIGVESTEETRRASRAPLFPTDGVEEFISGVILFAETIRQTTEDGTP